MNLYHFVTLFISLLLFLFSALLAFYTPRPLPAGVYLLHSEVGDVPDRVLVGQWSVFFFLREMFG